jgi:hypothetical protein
MHFGLAFGDFFRQSLSSQHRLLREQMVDNHIDCDASDWHSRVVGIGDFD